MKVSRRQALGLLGAGATTPLAMGLPQAKETYTSGHRQSAGKWIFRGSIVSSMLAVPITIHQRPELLFEVCSIFSGFSIRSELAQKLDLQGGRRY